jgi:glucose/arabinose dehydrogenase
MELRGTRPVRDDPDALCRFIPGNGMWWGWPDYTADMQPVYDPRFQPPPEMIARNGYPEGISFVIDQQATNLDAQSTAPLEDPSTKRDALLKGVFPSLAGAAKFDFIPSSSPLSKTFPNSVIVALSGDRAPFATGGQRYIKYIGPYGFKVVRVDLDRPKQVKDFVYNTRGGPRSRLNFNSPNLLERPVDLKFGPDGAIYILDAGRMEMKDGRERYDPGTGQIFRLVPIAGTMH